MSLLINSKWKTGDSYQLLNINSTNYDIKCFTKITEKFLRFI